MNKIIHCPNCDSLVKKEYDHLRVKYINEMPIDYWMCFKQDRRYEN